MKKIKELIEKFKNWLIKKLGGFTKGDFIRNVNRTCDAHFEALIPWRKTVQELCRKSDDTYYDWCCEYCAQPCNKRNGWCERFHPINKVKHDLEDIGA